MGLIKSSWIVGIMITLVGKRSLDKIKKSTFDPEKAQRKVLAGFIKDSKNTVFGKDHNFSSIKSYEDFKKNVPIRTYEDLGKYFELMFKGDSDVLFKGRPALYNTSSGTTGKPKLVPISEKFRKELSQFNKLWIYSILEQNPTIFEGKSLTSVGKAIEGYAEDGVPIGSISGNSFKSIPAIIQKSYSSTYPFFALDDYEMRYYAIARNGLEQDISLSICPSIANVLRYHQMVIENFDQMVEEIRTGTMREDILAKLSDEDRKDVLSRIAPNPDRADELIKLKEQHGDGLLPKHYWPNVAVINAWVQGNFSIMVEKLKPYFPETTIIRSFGYQASEGRFGISLDNHWTYSLLVPTQYFYEFISEDNREDENPPILMYHELEVGKRYYIIITNTSGLYRYDINDMLEVVGFHNKAPLLKFIQKGAGIINIMGEKLSEEQVIEATKQATSEMGVKVNNYLMFGDYKQYKYEFFVEFGDETTAEKKKIFIEMFDKKLSALNMEYASKRSSERLKIPTVIELPKNSHQKVKEGLVKRKLAKDGQFKDLYISAKEATREVLLDVCK
jgi:hypothetical protein